MSEIEVIRQDRYGSSGARSSSSSWYPGGRWIADFTNERGNQIHVEVVNHDDGNTKLLIRGPQSQRSDFITPMEAEALAIALSAATAARTNKGSAQ